MTDTERAISFFENALENCVMVARKPFEIALDVLRRTAEDDKAREEGRLVVLPCKVGDSVFSLLSPPHYKHGVVYEYKVVFIGINDSKDMGYGLFNVKSVKGEWMYPFNFSDIGKTVFLTRAEAEAALGGGGDA